LGARPGRMAGPWGACRRRVHARKRFGLPGVRGGGALRRAGRGQEPVKIWRRRLSPAASPCPPRRRPRLRVLLTALRRIACGDARRLACIPERGAWAGACRRPCRLPRTPPTTAQPTAVASPGEPGAAGDRGRAAAGAGAPGGGLRGGGGAPPAARRCARRGAPRRGGPRSPDRPPGAPLTGGAARPRMCMKGQWATYAAQRAAGGPGRPARGPEPLLISCPLRAPVLDWVVAPFQSLFSAHRPHWGPEHPDRGESNARPLHYRRPARRPPQITFRFDQRHARRIDIVKKKMGCAASKPALVGGAPPEDGEVLVEPLGAAPNRGAAGGGGGRPPAGALLTGCPLARAPRRGRAPAEPHDARTAAILQPRPQGGERGGARGGARARSACPAPGAVRGGGALRRGARRGGRAAAGRAAADGPRAAGAQPRGAAAAIAPRARDDAPAAHAPPRSSRALADARGQGGGRDCGARDGGGRGLRHQRRRRRMRAGGAAAAGAAARGRRQRRRGRPADVAGPGAGAQQRHALAPAVLRDQRRAQEGAGLAGKGQRARVVRGAGCGRGCGRAARGRAQRRAAPACPQHPPPPHPCTPQKELAEKLQAQFSDATEDEEGAVAGAAEARRALPVAVAAMSRAGREPGYKKTNQDSCFAFEKYIGEDESLFGAMDGHGPNGAAAARAARAARARARGGRRRQRRPPAAVMARGPCLFLRCNPRPPRARPSVLRPPRVCVCEAAPAAAARRPPRRRRPASRRARGRLPRGRRAPRGEPHRLRVQRVDVRRGLPAGERRGGAGAARAWATAGQAGVSGGPGGGRTAHTRAPNA
jgi:hypothetical protein